MATPPSGKAASYNDAEKSKNSRACNKQKKPPLTFSDPDALVTFLIGKESDPPKKFVVHKEFACHASPVFDAAFDGNFIEGQTQTYKLDDTTPRAFQLLTQWIYQEKLKIALLGRHIEKAAKMPGHSTEEMIDESMALAELWVLADKLRMPALQNLVVDTISAIETTTQKTAVSIYKHVYDWTAPESKLRKWAVEVSAGNLEESTFKSHAQWFPHEMLIDIITYKAARERNPIIPKSNLTTYHVPVDDESNK